MSEAPHPYYAGLQRWIDAQDKYTVSSLATAAGLNNATIRNGLKSWHAPSSSTIQKIKDVIGLNYEEVIDFYEIAPPPMPPGTPPRPALAPRSGFAESDVAPWIPKPDDPEGRRVGDMAGFLSGDRGGRDVWRVKSRAMILAGFDDRDFILVDQHAAPEAGDVVIAQVYDHELGTASTLLRRFDPPVLSSASPDPADWKPHVVDGRNVKIMGVVTASWRTK